MQNCLSYLYYCRKIKLFWCFPFWNSFSNPFYSKKKNLSLPRFVYLGVKKADKHKRIPCRLAPDGQRKRKKHDEVEEYRAAVDRKAIFWLVHANSLCLHCWAGTTNFIDKNAGNGPAFMHCHLCGSSRSGGGHQKGKGLDARFIS